MKICFVCLGNINRSRAAEAILKAKRPDIEVFSRGLLATTAGKPISQEMLKCLSVEEQRFVSKGAKVLTEEDILSADSIFLMDAEVFRLLSSTFDRKLYAGKLHFLDKEIADPHTTNKYNDCYILLKECINKLSVTLC